MNLPSNASLCDIPIQFAKGVGPRRARLLEKLGVGTLEDAFWFVPWRYENRLDVSPIATLLPGSKTTIRGTVQRCWAKTTYRRRLSLVTVRVQDESGTMDCVFFNQPYLEKTFVPGTILLLTGPVSENGSSLHMRGPQYEIVAEGEEQDSGGRIIPIYHETQGLSSKQIRRIMKSLFDHYIPNLPEILSSDQRGGFGFPTLSEALPPLHFPKQDQSVDELNQFKTVEHQRLAFEELFLLQLALAMRRSLYVKGSVGVSFHVANALLPHLKELLPFSLTSAQERVIGEIFQDMERESCMNRLLQGDVGCGKTIVALHAIVVAVGSGFQVALMAPTEVLSEQHYESLRPFFDALGLDTILLKGGQTGSARKTTLENIHSGRVQVVVGTHALLQSDVQFGRLGLVIVDEQHKFGVVQRAQLREKARWDPDVLVMTATPIPRTLAMTLYGDLDVSVIDEFPPGKKPVHTRLFGTTDRMSAYEVLREELQAGRQGYVVFPLIEASEKVDLQAAVDAVEDLQETLAPFRIGLLHGRLTSTEKREVMAQFQQHTLDVLVATTVVEVGLDIHNATVMIIEHAERFGLAQLHQLRGRVGRGQWPGCCLLIHGLGNVPSYTKQTQLPLTTQEATLIGNQGDFQRIEIEGSTARYRLCVFAHFLDGFALAEEDLKIRGPGHILGVKQWGEFEFKVADLTRDFNLLMKAKALAREVMDSDPELSLPEHRDLKAILLKKWGKTFHLGTVG